MQLISGALPQGMGLARETKMQWCSSYLSNASSIRSQPRLLENHRQNYRGNIYVKTENIKRKQTDGVTVLNGWQGWMVGLKQRLTWDLLATSALEHVAELWNVKAGWMQDRRRLV